MIKQFDIVKLKTTKNVRYISSPNNNPTKPTGNWSVIGFIGNEILLSKDLTIIKVLINDVIKVANYKLPLGEFGYVEKEERK